MVYLMMMVSLARKPLVGSSRIVRFTNLRYPWQLRALGSCGGMGRAEVRRAHEREEDEAKL